MYGKSLCLFGLLSLLVVRGVQMESKWQSYDSSGLGNSLLWISTRSSAEYASMALGKRWCRGVVRHFGLAAGVFYKETGHR
jgi:hypothetical protein